jgi:hypothetical protein
MDRIIVSAFIFQQQQDFYNRSIEDAMERSLGKF